jgi:chemotaxis protein MotB
MRKKKHGAHANHERWLVSYADFITLLFAFFVVMFSSSQVDKRKAGKLAMAMQVAFEKFSLLQSSNLRPPLTKDMAPYDHVRSVEQSIRTNELKIPIPGTKAAANLPQPADMNALAKDLDQALRLQIVKHEIAVKQGREGVIISLREVGFFESGSAGVKIQAEPTLEEIARFLRTVTNYIRIEGHTDNQAMHSTRYASNWELSAARATDMLNVFINQYHIEPQRLSVGGYAEFHPLASNDTPEGRAQNRRVDIVVLNNFTR